MKRRLQRRFKRRVQRDKRVQLSEEGAAGGGRVVREKNIASGTSNSDRRGYVGGAEGETESVLAAFFSSDIAAKSDSIISSIRSF